MIFILLFSIKLTLADGSSVSEEDPENNDDEDVSDSENRGNSFIGEFFDQKTIKKIVLHSVHLFSLFVFLSIIMYTGYLSNSQATVELAKNSTGDVTIQEFFIIQASLVVGFLVVTIILAYIIFNMSSSGRFGQSDKTGKTAGNVPITSTVPLASMISSTVGQSTMSPTSGMAVTSEIGSPTSKTDLGMFSKNNTNKFG